MKLLCYLGTQPLPHFPQQPCRLQSQYSPTLISRFGGQSYRKLITTYPSPFADVAVTQQTATSTPPPFPSHPYGTLHIEFR